MNIFQYFHSKKSLVLFYFILIIFISLVIYFDNNMKVSLGNIVYINIAGVILFVLYLIFEYLKNKRYYDTIKYVIDTYKENSIISLPEPLNYEQGLYNNLIVKLQEEFDYKIDKLGEEKRENLDFMSSWVHDIKTPISACRLIIENSMNTTKEESLSNIEDEMDYIENYVEQALYYSKLDSFSKDYLISEINMKDLINSLIKKHAKEFIGKKIKIELGELEFMVDSDKKWLFFIIDQILSNSLKYTKNNGIIKISGAVKEKEKVIYIEDNGIGIKLEDIQRVFDKGFTGHNGRENYKSTGMGLYFSKNLASKLGHNITIESKFNEFTRVAIHFPKLIDYYNIAK